MGLQILLISASTIFNTNSLLTDTDSSDAELTKDDVNKNNFDKIKET
jgi:hypothetical protein